MSDVSLHHRPDPDTEPLVQRLLHRRYLGEYADPVLARGAAEAQVGRMSDRARHFEVRAHGERRGHVWLVRQADDLAAVDVTLEEEALAPAVRAAVEDLARAEGFRRLIAPVWPGDLVGETFVRGGGFEVAAVQMRLDLAHELPAEDVVTLEPMDEAAYAVWEADGIDAYAEERAGSGESPERARTVAEEQYAELLPDGLTTEHHHFFVGRAGDETVGILWLSTERPMAFVYDVAVEEAHRRRGYGAGLMRAGARWAQQRGAHALGLNVFGHNHGAKALYDRLGYCVVEDLVAKTL